MENNINIEEMNKKITEWLKDKENDPHWLEVQEEVKAYNKEIGRITNIIESDYDRHAELIKEALDFYFREAYNLKDLKKWK